jgi:hypothetical protein
MQRLSVQRESGLDYVRSSETFPVESVYAETLYAVATQGHPIIERSPQRYRSIVCPKGSLSGTALSWTGHVARQGLAKVLFSPPFWDSKSRDCALA